MEATVVDLNELTLEGQISCPYCRKARIYSYGAKGKSSQECPNCHNYVLWDYDRMIGLKATVKKVNNR